MKLETITRKEITSKIVEDYFAELKAAFNKKIEKRGNGGFINYLECLGKLQEEYAETVEAVHQKDKAQVKDELTDVVITAILGVMSL